MKTTLTIPARAGRTDRPARAGSYHRADLRSELLQYGIELARSGGPDAVSVRDVQRRAGVSNSAAYRHYADRTALVQAISDYASSQMANRMEQALRSVGRRRTKADAARARLRALGRVYIDYALEEPGLFATAFIEKDADTDPAQASDDARGEGGLGPFELLARALDDLVTTGALPQKLRAHSDIAAWAAVHGLAVLLLHGPVSHLTGRDREAAIERLLDVVMAGLG